MKKIEVVAAVITKDGRYFATQRGYGAFKDWWEFPGGKMEAGETRETALRREIHEELDTVVSVDEFITTVECDYPEFHLTMHCFYCSVISGRLELREAEDARWLRPSDLLSVRWLPADKQVVEKMLSEA